MLQRKADWRQAYLNTPHGLPIELVRPTSPMFTITMMTITTMKITARSQ